MLKRILAGTLVFIVLSTTGTVAYTGKVNYTNDIEIIKPKDGLVTAKKMILLSGTAEDGTSITVEVYLVDETAEDYEDVIISIDDEIMELEGLFCDEADIITEEENPNNIEDVSILTEENIINVAVDTVLEEDVVLDQDNEGIDEGSTIPVIPLVKLERATTLEEETSEHEKEDELISTQEFEVDELGIFNREIELSIGKNKIVIYVKKNDEVLIEKIKFVTVTDPERAKEYVESVDKIKELDNIKNEIIGNETESETENESLGIPTE